MNKTLLVGPAGSGKTYEILNQFESALRESDDPLHEDYFLILPSAEHTERMISLLIQRGIAGFFHRRITTFSRLIHDVFSIGDEGIATNVTRFLILRELFENNRWPYFEAVQESAGFVNLMLSFISELKESLVSVRQFRERMNGLKRLEPDLAVKYEALAGIYEAYEAALAARGLRDRQDALEIYRRRKGRGDYAKRRFRHIWLDGFYDFTQMQLAYLAGLAGMSDEILVTLTLDSSRQGSELFENVKQTECALTDLGFRPRALKRRAESFPPGLGHIEKNLFAPSRPKTFPKSCGDVMLLEAIGMEGEIEMIARMIEKIHQAGSCRFSDIALLFRRIGEYESVVRSVFSRYRIPYEIHERERLHFSPLIQVILRLFRIFREDWKRNDLMEFLKSSYVQWPGEAAHNPDWVNELEHRAMRQGVFRSRRAWMDLEPALEPLATLQDELEACRSLKTLRASVLKALSETFGIFRCHKEVSGLARRDAAGRNRFKAILDEIDRSFLAASEISFEAFSDRFFRLAELDLYSIHERDKNRVQIYDVSMARQKEYRVVFVSGLLEKRFPVQIKEDPVLSDWERRLFNGDRSEGILKERLLRQTLERYLFYLAVTRTREKLFLTYPRLDLEGKEYLPSYYIEEIKALFNAGLPVARQELSRPYPLPTEAVTRRELEMGVMGELWRAESAAKEDESLLMALTNRILEEPQSRARFERAFFSVRDELTDPAIFKVDAFQTRRTSATKLEEYAKCPFRYYAHRVLGLEDPQEDVNVMMRGIILHEVLEQCFRVWSRTPDILTNLKRARAMALEQLERSLAAHPLVLERHYQRDLEYEDLRETLERFLDYELDRLRQAPLRPAYFEFSFGLKGAEKPAFEIRDGREAILVTGKIDRIDVDEEQGAASVIDYKRSATFKRGELELGVALQLPLYLMVLERYLHLRPVAGELYSIRGLEKKGFYHQDYTNLFPGMSSRRMILTAAEFRELLERAAGFIRKYIRGMKALDMRVRPRVCESYCPYAAVCRIEKWRLPLILEQIREEETHEKNGKEKGAV